MGDDDLKRLIETAASETRRHFGVVAERLEHEIRLVSEAVRGVGERVDLLASRVDRIGEVVDEHGVKLDLLTSGKLSPGR